MRIACLELRTYPHIMDVDYIGILYPVNYTYI